MSEQAPLYLTPSIPKHTELTIDNKVIAVPDMLIKLALVALNYTPYQHKLIEDYLIKELSAAGKSPTADHILEHLIILIANPDYLNKLRMPQ